MLITFFSNYYNHHQKALCDALNAIGDVEFYFVETEVIEKFRKDMGWGENAPSYCIKSYESDEKNELALTLARSSDVVIIGSAPEYFVERRIAQGLLTFRYTERPMKEGWIKMFIPRLFKKFYHLHYRHRSRNNIFVLGASGFASYDYSLMKAYPGRCLKFGYFPFPETRMFEELCGQKNARSLFGELYGAENIPEGVDLSLPTVLWSGRFLRLKRADLLIKVAVGLLGEEVRFNLVLIGEGETEDDLRKLAGSCRNIYFHGFVSPEKIRTLMGMADIYVMSSNFLEGWGSVIYEALSAGCGVIASHACGSTPFLIKDKKNGLIFKSGKEDSLKDALRIFINDRELLFKCQKNAYDQMQELWNPKVASDRIYGFSKAFLEGADTKKLMEMYDDGPLSRAAVIKNNWF